MKETKRSSRVILLMSTLTALIFLLSGCGKTANISDGIVALRVYSHHTAINGQPEGIRHYVIVSTGEHGEVAECESFEPDEAEVFAVQLPFQMVDGAIVPDLGPITIRDSGGVPVNDDTLYAIAEQLRNRPYGIHDIKIIHTGGEYMLWFAEKEWLYTPCFLYYYNAEQQKIHLLNRCQDMEIEAVRIVSPQKLHGMDEER